MNRSLVMHGAVLRGLEKTTPLHSSLSVFNFKQSKEEFVSVLCAEIRQSGLLKRKEYGSCPFVRPVLVLLALERGARSKMGRLAPNMDENTFTASPARGRGPDERAPCALRQDTDMAPQRLKASWRGCLPSSNRTSAHRHESETSATLFGVVRDRRRAVLCRPRSSRPPSVEGAAAGWVTFVRASYRLGANAPRGSLCRRSGVVRGCVSVVGRWGRWLGRRG